MNPVESAAAFALLAFLPGFLLVKELFPRRAEGMDTALTAFLSVVLSIALTILVGTVLGVLPHGSGRGFFQGAATGFPFIELTLLALAFALFLVALGRGAFPRLLKKANGRDPSRALATPAVHPALEALKLERLREYRLEKARRASKDPRARSTIEDDLAASRAAAADLEARAREDQAKT